MIPRSRGRIWAHDPARGNRNGDSDLIVYAGQIGADGLYLLFIWLISAALSATVAERKGYGERVGLTFGLLLSAIGLVIVLLIPARPGSRWKVEGPLPPRVRRHDN
jgi:hypothetical protein